MNEDRGPLKEIAPDIVEPLLVIGRAADGSCIVQTTRLNPASCVVLLEQMRQALVGQFRFDRAQLVTPAAGPLPPADRRIN